MRVNIPAARTCVLLALVALLSVPARADFTAVRDSGSEATVKEIFEHYFDPATSFGADTGTMNAAHESYTFSKGGVDVTATRVNDFGLGHGSSIDLLTGTPDDLDMVWTDGVTHFTAEARFAAFTQSFGLDANLANGIVDHSILFSVSGHGFIQDGLSGSGGPKTLSGTWAWTRGGTGHGPWSSVSTSNSDDFDHMITYLVDDGGSERTWWLFFEDLNNLGDADYNDLVVEVRAVPVPAPTAVLLGVVGLSAVGLIRRRFG